MKMRVLLQGSAVCAVVWTTVLVAQGYFARLRLTAERVEEAVAQAELVDWTGREGEPTGAEAAAREEKIREVAGMISKLDFTESGKARQERVAQEFFWKLSPNERALFVNLTMEKVLAQWMAVFEAMTPEDQEKFLKRGLKEFEVEMNPQNIERMQKLGEDMGRIVKAGGFRAYFEGKTAAEKMEMAPLLEIMHELMQRLRMPKWEGRDRED